MNMHDRPNDLTVRFRLDDNHDIGPFKFNSLSTVHYLKEFIIAQWPQGRANRPTSVEGVQLLYGGRELENNKTLGQSNILFPAELVTLHVAVRQHRPRRAITLPDGHILRKLGFVSLALQIGNTCEVTITATHQHPRLAVGAPLWLTQSRRPLGTVSEVVQTSPDEYQLYVVRYEIEEDIPEITHEARVSYAASSVSRVP